MSGCASSHMIRASESSAVSSSRFHRQFRAGVQEMTFTITPSQGACGATISGLDLSRELDPSVIRDIREAWLRHHVLAFPDQNMDDEDLERFSLYFGSFAGDPYIAPLDDRPNVIEIRRTADERSEERRVGKERRT